MNEEDQKEIRQMISNYEKICEVEKTLEELAKTARMMFDSFVNQGFNESQAERMTTAWLMNMFNK